MKGTPTRMIRKQLYIEPRQQKKLRALASLWERNEAEVMRAAIDRLPDPDASVKERLRAAGLLQDPPEDDDLPALEQIPALESETDAWLLRLPGPLGLSEAVLEDRR